MRVTLELIPDNHDETKIDLGAVWPLFLVRR
jgi:hypothetical protein